MFWAPTGAVVGTVTFTITHTGVPAVAVMGALTTLSPASSTALQFVSRHSVCGQPRLLLMLKATLPPLPGVKVWA